MITIYGKASRDFAPIIGEATFSPKKFYDRSRYILLSNTLDFGSLAYKGCVITGDKGRFYHPDHIYQTEDINKIKEGDIIKLDGSGRIDVLWEINSTQNCLFLTENCNCRCVMCPQPPTSINSKIFINDANNVLDLIHEKNITDICLTGGEPSLTGKSFFNILYRCVDEHPNARIHILTNGKLFADKDFANQLSGVPVKNILFCVSLHSEVDTLHDEIVGTTGSYAKTQQGIYNLASMGFPIEIRVVVSRYNYIHLPEFAKHLYNYFPFCTHYALMGLELHGLAESNIELVNISPDKYMPYLREAVLTMARRELPVSIYNIPLCFCPEDIKNFARQSISSWKNIYLPACSECCAKEKCCGFFSTSVSLDRKWVKPIRGVEV